MIDKPILAVKVVNNNQVVKTSYGLVTILGSALFVDFNSIEVYCTYDGYKLLRDRKMKEYLHFNTNSLGSTLVEKREVGDIVEVGGRLIAIKEDTVVSDPFKGVIYCTETLWESLKKEIDKQNDKTARK